ncbi:MAG TPA: glycoside hydrolase family 57 protein [Vicinamibacterales bacterium]|nr:glycoside hydrolase family 57 protein [Vicinamibacterales bacterium]
MTRVALLWHMHQPYYEDLVTREHILPWVRLHALKDYYGMAALLREFPGVKVTFNLVPSLLVQLEAFAGERARDPFLELSLKPADALTESDVAFILENFFHAQRQRMIDVYPRYRELLEKRGSRVLFSVDDLRDLQVWHKIAWVDPFYLDADERIRRLVAKGRQFSEDDKQTLRAVELEILNRVIPEYRDGVARGQIEVSTSPFYHPILPLLCDTDIYLRTHPASAMPKHRFQHPEDASLQLERAVACHERLFGRRPAGLWPSEGSVSDAMAPLVAKAGFRWMATDEQILANTLGIAFTRDGSGNLEQPERLYTPYQLTAGGTAVSCVFRDHALSDLIGFVYSGWQAEAAADDFVGRLAAAGRRYRERTGGGEALIPVILDGENAWEHFEGGGRPFLRALYRRLERHPELTTVTMSEATARSGPSLASIFPGSWIDSNFYIWIGHRDDQRAWDQVADARAMLDRASATAGAAALEAAREEVLIAEGSDWFWWYGDDHSSDHDEAFDDLFRRHLRNAYRLLHEPVPEELFVTNITTAAPSEEVEAPVGWLTPTLDGRDTSYFEWLGAGRFDARRTAGAMHQIDAAPTVVASVRFGFTRSGNLCVRLDGPSPMAEQLAAGYEFTLAVLEPTSAIITAASNGSDNGCYVNYTGAKVAASVSLELAVPIRGLGLSPGALVSFAITVSRRPPAAGQPPVAVERHPASHPIAVRVPGADFDAAHWRA